jgi:hypothetical protein
MDTVPSRSPVGRSQIGFSCCSVPFRLIVYREYTYSIQRTDTENTRHTQTSQHTQVHSYCLPRKKKHSTQIQQLHTKTTPRNGTQQHYNPFWLRPTGLLDGTVSILNDTVHPTFFDLDFDCVLYRGGQCASEIHWFSHQNSSHNLFDFLKLSMF